VRSVREVGGLGQQPSETRLKPLINLFRNPIIAL
jgi:hypothetical protein